MKRLLAVLLLLVMVVAISGCTSNTTSNKTYSANGVTFTYPGTGSEQNSSSLNAAIGTSGQIMGSVGDNSTFYFGVAKINLDSDQRLATLNEWATSFNQTIKNNNQTYLSEKNTTVDGVNGIVITFNDSDFYYHEMFFIKNNTGYLAILLSNNNNEALFNDIISTLKIV